MKKCKTILAVFGTLMILVGLSLFAGQADLSKLTGNWEIELDAEGEYYYLNMTLEESAGKLAGTIAEANGYFSDIKLEDIFYDGKKFTFKCTAPTPPDGMERIIMGDFEVGDGKLQGYINVEDLGLSAPAAATRK